MLHDKINTKFSLFPTAYSHVPASIILLTVVTSICSGMLQAPLSKANNDDVGSIENYTLYFDPIIDDELIKL